jgi:hypothetical protein
MKSLFLLLLLLTIDAGITKPSYDTALLYPIEMDEQSGMSRLFSKGNVIESESKGMKLSVESVDELFVILNDTSTYGALHSYSHAPTIGIVFYKKQKIVDWIQIALATNTVETKHKIRAKEKYSHPSLDPEYLLTGLSPQGRLRIRNWYKKMNVEDTGAEYSHWDSTRVDYTQLKRNY